MTAQLRNSTDAEENPVLEIEVPEKSTGIDVLYPNSDNDEIVVLQLAKDFHETFSKWEHNAARAESYLLYSLVYKSTSCISQPPFSRSKIKFLIKKNKRNSHQ